MKNIYGKDWNSISSDVSVCDILGDYFPKVKSTEIEKLNAFNLGVYSDYVDDGKCKATQYIGAMPILRMDDGVQGNAFAYAFIDSRFNISPTDMLMEILDGKDYYENPDLFETKIYSVNEWRELGEAQKNGSANSKSSEKSKILFGVVNGLGEIDLKSAIAKDGIEETQNFCVSIAEQQGIFEIIDFVNKAKTACKKNLKRQSQKVEENLYGKVKGRILVQKQIKYNEAKGRVLNVYCAYNKISDDTAENRILKYALHLCQKNSKIGHLLAEDINYCLNILAGVPLKRCSISDFAGLKNNSAYKHYKDAMSAAKKIINRYYIGYENASEAANKKETSAQIYNYKIVPYFIDMNVLFELYCRAMTRKAIDKYNEKNCNKDGDQIFFELESARDAKRKLWLEEKPDVGSYYMHTYIPDVVIRYKYKDAEGVAAVLDAKNSNVEKTTDKKRERTHQILFYMKVMDCMYGGLMSPDPGKEEWKKSSLEGITKKILCHIPMGSDSAMHKVSLEELEKFLEELAKNKECFVVDQSEKDREILEKWHKIEQVIKEVISGKDPSFAEFEINKNKKNDLKNSTIKNILKYMWEEYK